jgi:hypothetical protein
MPAPDITGAADKLIVANGEPAAGAPTEDLVAASVVGVLLLMGLGAFGVAHRSGKTNALARLADFSQRIAGLPGWAALPMAIAGISLIVAVFGFYWDVATHIDNGRDPGPFANPAHFLIIAGLAGIALSGITALLLGCEESTASVRIRSGWHVPIGGVLLLVCGGIAVLGFPLDDVWHRLFGQDVTLWSPTHMQMVGGAALATLALWILHVEGVRAAPDPDRARKLSRVAEPFVAGAVLIGLSAFQAEFDYSVPQFRLLYHPVLLMMSAGVALVAARIRMGPGGALKAVAFFLVVRASVSVVVGPVMGHTTLHFPLYVVEALAVEFVAFWAPTDRRIRFGVLAGLAVGTFGLAAEWAWSHAWMTMEWPTSLLPEGVVLGVLAGVTGGCLGGIIGGALIDDPEPRQDVSRRAVIATAAGVLLLLAYPFPTNSAFDASAEVSLDRGSGARGHSAKVAVAVHPTDAADDAEWFNVTAWQGGGSVVEDLERLGEGTYQTVHPIPIDGNWKTLIRLHRGRSLVAVPIYLPKDQAIPADEVPATSNFTRGFIADKRILLREAKDVETWITYTASGVLIVISMLWAATLGWGLRRLEAGGFPRERLMSADLAHAQPL